MSRIHNLEVMSLFRAGKESEAMHEALVGVRFGHRVQESADSFIRYLLAARIKGASLWLIQRMTAITEQRSSALLPLIADLEVYGANANGLTNLLKCEYQTSKAILDDMSTGKTPGVSPMQELGHRFALKPVYRPHQTKALLAERVRGCLAAIYKHGHQMRFARDPAITTNGISMVRLLVSGNASGRILADLAATNWERMMLGKCRWNNDLHATRLLLALRCYLNDHGTLPESLDALVPAYLDRVPLDDYDGQPFRYSREKKRLYSVGDNFQDDGGVERDAQGERLDYAYPIEF